MDGHLPQPRHSLPSLSPDDSPYREAPRSKSKTPLSCRECSRRKIKCDKQVPCRACRDRGEGDSCHRRPTRPSAMDATTTGTDPAILSELEDHRRRIARLEAALLQFNWARVPDSSTRRPDLQTDLQENQLVGAIEEAALGIGEPRRWQGAPRLLTENTGYPLSGQHGSQKWFSMGLSACLDALPPQRESQLLIDAFCKYLNWFCGCVHVPTLLGLHRDFWSLAHQGKPPDGISLALLFAVLSTTAHLLDDDQASIIGISNLMLRKTAPLWFDCCLATFFRCDGLVRPSILACQTIITLSSSFHLSGNTAVHGAMGHLRNGYARALNLHLLGEDRSGSARDIVHREIGRRVWWHVVELQWYFATYHRHSRKSSVPETCH